MNNEREFDLLPLLEHINPAVLSYQEWINVGMALKHEGYTASDWDNWSQNDSRYRKFECFKKWDTFNEQAGSIVTGRTIVQLAKDHGWVNPYSSDSEGAHELDWNDTIDRDYRVIDKNWIEVAKPVYSLSGAMVYGGLGVNKWLENEDNQRVFALAWFDGYEVEKEKRYTVKIKGEIEENLLVYGLGINRYFFARTYDSSKRNEHTRKQLEEAGFGWVFDCPGIEVEEVE
jgi:hypothetical protein